MREIVARDLMTPDVLSVPDSLPLSELAAFLIDHQVTGVTVTNDSGEYVGVVSATDLVAATSERGCHLAWDDACPDFYLRGPDDRFAQEELPNLRLSDDDVCVRDVMTPKIFSVALDDGVSEIAELMLKGHLHRVLVIDGDTLAGIVTTSDLLGLLIEGRQV